MTYATPAMRPDLPTQQRANVIQFPTWHQTDTATARRRHPSYQTATVPAAAVVDFVEALTDIFVELRFPEMSEAVKGIDGILAELDSSDEWRSAGINTETTLSTTAARFRQIAAGAAQQFPAPTQMRLMLLD